MTVSDLTLGEIRRELLALTAQAGLVAGHAARHPTAVNGADHPMPGPEWSIPSRTRHWVVRAATSAADTDCVYVNTPGCMSEDFDAIGTAQAREVALAILSACDYADHVRAGLAPPRAAEAVKIGLRLAEHGESGSRR